MKYCGYCGNQNDDNAKFCGACGKPFVTEQKDDKKDNQDWLNHIGNYVGSEQPINLNWRVLFTDVFKKHSKDEVEEIFRGKQTDTLELNSISKTWPHPWLYSRVLLVLMVAFVLLYVCIMILESPMALPGLMLIGAFAVPLAALVLFFELNAYKNVRLYEVVITFLIGGCLSLVLTLMLYTIFSVEQLDYTGAFTVGFVEEVGKAIIVYYFIKRLDIKNILAGLLIGAAVGAGFAAFETAGYVMFSGAESWDNMMSTIFIRGFLAPGGHVAWAAISGAAIVIAAKDKGEMNAGVFFNVKFLRMFIIPILLHWIWDSPLSIIGIDIFLVPIILTIGVWIVVLVLVNMGLAAIPVVDNSDNRLI